MEHAVEIERPLLDFILVHEIHCVGSCCGDDAFEFSPNIYDEDEHASQAILEIDFATVIKQIHALKHAMRQRSDSFFHPTINISWSGSEHFDQWMNHIESLARIATEVVDKRTT